MVQNLTPRTHLPFRVYLAIGVSLSALVVYSQLVAYWGDESLHLLAGQLIKMGRLPYRDFFYQHTPLFAYLNAALILVFGASWRAAHLVSALLTGGCILLTARYVFEQTRDAKVGTTVSGLTVVFLGLNAYVICFGTVALPYGYCLFFTTASFYMVTKAVGSRRGWVACGAGFCAGAASASYLLTAPVLAICFFWILRHNLANRRLKKSCYFLLGATLPFVPTLWLFYLAPRQTFFDLVQYHLFYRVGRDLDLGFNLHEVNGWFFSIQGCGLTALAVIGLLFIEFSGRAKFAARQKSEFRLCAALAIFLILFISCARPTSAFYFVLITPFVTILAAIGIYAISTQWEWLSKLIVLAVVALYLVGTYDMKYIWRWQGTYWNYRDVLAISREVDEVTPRDGLIYAFEAVYFEANRLPPPGLENRFNPASQADQWLATGRFDTIYIAAINPRLKSFDLLSRYANSKEINLREFRGYLLWGRK